MDFANGSPMLPEPFPFYVCPTCRAPLSFDGAADRLSGTLSCAAGHAFPVSGGLPRFVTDAGYSGSFGFQWQRHSKDQVDSASGSLISRDRVFKGTGWPEDMTGQTILEAGCGSGRFTEVLLSTGATVFSFDYSEAADVTYQNCADRGAHVCQASIYDMPFPNASFDRVFCYGVIQHTPDVHASFQRLVAMVKPGGHLAVDVYDSRKWLFNARYRVRWYTKHMDKQRLHRLCQRLVPAYMKLMPPLHPWNQLLVPLKDYRGVLPGLTLQQQIDWSILDTFDMLSPAFDLPQSLRTMQRWCDEAGLVDVTVRRGGNGIEVSARKPATGV
jgi:SAM-dependent methyltransferase